MSFIIKFTLFNDCCSNLRRFPYKGCSEFNFVARKTLKNLYRKNGVSLSNNRCIKQILSNFFFLAMNFYLIKFETILTIILFLKLIFKIKSANFYDFLHKKNKLSHIHILLIWPVLFILCFFNISLKSQTQT